MSQQADELFGPDARGEETTALVVRDQPLMVPLTPDLSWTSIHGLTQRLPDRSRRAETAAPGW
jgi:hypothetical protein